MVYGQRFEKSFKYAFDSDFYDCSKKELLEGRLKDLFVDLSITTFSEEELKDILFDRIWKELHLKEIKHANIRKKVFDFSTEFGSEQTAVFVQRSLNSGWDSKLFVDRDLGNEEIKLINNIEDKKILERIICHHVASFCEIFAETKNINFLMRWVFR